MPKDPPEHHTPSAADALAKRIEAYWRQRGGDVVCYVKEDASKLHGIYSVRSDLLNGAPRKPLLMF
jgi:hypothetical protein